MKSVPQKKTGSGSVPWHSLPIESVALLHLTDIDEGLSDQDVFIRSPIGRGHLRDGGITRLLSGLQRVPGSVIIIFLLGVAIYAYLELWWGYSLVSALSLLGILASYHLSTVRDVGRQPQARLARVMRNGRIEFVPPQSLVLGDVILVSAGDIVPALGRLFTAMDLVASERVALFRSQKVRKTACELTAATDRSNLVKPGTRIISGCGKAIVVERPKPKAGWI